MRLAPVSVMTSSRERSAVRRDLPVLLVVAGYVLAIAAVAQATLWWVGPVVATLGAGLAVTRAVGDRWVSPKPVLTAVLVVLTVGVWWFVGSWPVTAEVVTR